jgi:hypothetical protein
MLYSAFFISLPQLEQNLGVFGKGKPFSINLFLKISLCSAECSSSILQLSQNLVLTRRYFPQERHLNHSLRPHFLQNSLYLPIGALQRGQLFLSNQK